MIVIMGTREFAKRLGRSKKMIRCENCGNEAYWGYFRYRAWRTLNFIPIFPTSSRNVFFCPACHYGIEVDKGNSRVLSLIDLTHK